ncbi:MAG: formyl transferase [Proteobacteria bacterium]|nr:formyl transferase [Pseudomonadota bacterium]MDA0927874.1 formyl transferase [Pseudomonadota bacterium]
MNITLLVNRDVASCLALNYLFNALPAHRLTVFYSARVGSKPLPEPLQRLKFFEQDFFNRFVFPLQLELADSDSVELLGFELLARKLEGRCFELNDINAAEGMRRYRESNPDLVLSIRYGVILKDAAIAIPRLGVLNLHSGLLPAYQGVMASFWALLNGEQTLGTTLHRITDSTIDTGPIIDTTILKVRREKSYLWHVLSLYEEGCTVMARAAQELAAGGSLESRPQMGDSAYYSFPQDEDLASFEQGGMKLFDPIEVLELAKRFCFHD